MDAWERIAARTGVRFEAGEASGLSRERGEAAGVALEEVLSRASAPELYAAALAGAGERGTTLLRLLGCSRLFAGIVGQNPELIALLLEEPGAPVPWRERVGREIELGLSASSGYRHALDRLRWVRQWAFAQAMARAAAGESAIGVASDLAATAEGLVRGTMQALARFGGFEAAERLTVIGFGKLGGGELNLSSDIDLAYVAPDGLSDAEERAMLRAAEALSRGLEEPMGRGFLYRVDLRLRPYGGRGALVPSMRATEAYYARYAEDWELQALLRGRALLGPEAERWEEMRRAALAERRWGDAAVEGLLAGRTRTEEAASADDLKRGLGGIRDVETVVQIATLLTGAEAPLLPRDLPGCLESLVHRRTFGEEEGRRLAAAYGTLRSAEHAVQARGGRQTHEWPESPRERELASGCVGPLGGEELHRQIQRARAAAGEIYAARFGREGGKPEGGGSAEARALLARFDPAYAGAAAESVGAWGRIEVAVRKAPAIVRDLRDAEIVEELISGEIAERSPFAAARIGGSEAELVEAAGRWRREHARRWLRFVLTGVEGAAVHPAAEAFVGSGLEVFLLGSLASGSDVPDSDADLLILRRDDDEPARAEAAAREGLRRLERMRREGAPAAVDLRLRPEGGRGALVHSVTAFRRYDEEAMAGWERLALGSARRVTGDDPGAAEAVAAASARPLSPEGWRELVAVKDRVERERSGGEDDLKLGPGGIMDAEWAAWVGARVGTAAASEEDRRWVIRAHRLRRLGAGDMLSPTLTQGEEEAAPQEARDRIRAAWLAARGRIEGSA